MGDNDLEDVNKNEEKESPRTYPVPHQNPSQAPPEGHANQDHQEEVGAPQERSQETEPGDVAPQDPSSDPTQIHGDQEARGPSHDDAEERQGIVEEKGNPEGMEPSDPPNPPSREEATKALLKGVEEEESKIRGFVDFPPSLNENGVAIHTLYTLFLTQLTKIKKKIALEKSRAPAIHHAPTSIDTQVKDKPSALHDFIKGPRFGTTPISGASFEYTIKSSPNRPVPVAYNSFGRLLPKKALLELYGVAKWGLHIGGDDMVNTYGVMDNGTEGLYNPSVSTPHSHLQTVLRAHPTFYLQPLPNNDSNSHKHDPTNTPEPVREA